ncbi:ESPR-type extended signal peptide-containing protein [Haemophilus parainfluenzae]|uniref:ESPR-type extended signal peptide-containing protein n=1 Tax=Haemophilus parainfluenzae TaxID=729 RepID=UPI001FB4D51B|nr:ESPR-type extended signal peptide-containing protein [Haemophilus parainfluenzae]
MNKIFRVIWNHATQSWVAVSELASAKGKTKSKTNKIMLASLVVGSSVIASNSFAAQISTPINNGIGINGTNIYVKPNGGTVTAETSGTSTIGDTISIGTSSTIRDGEILIGNNIRNTATGNSADVVIGHRALLGGGGQDSMSTGVGYGIQVAGPSIALGVGARADIADASGWNAVKNGGTAIGAYSMIGGNKNGSVALGAIAAADANGAVALGTLSGSATQWLDYANRGLGFNTNDTTGTYTTSVGYKSGARGFDSVAVGVNASTGLDDSAKGAVAVGNSTRAYGEGSLALGNRSVAGGYTDAMITKLNTKKTQVEAELTKAKERLAYWNEQAAQDASAYNKFNVGNLNAIVARLELTLERTKDDLTRALTAKGIPSSITSNFALAVGTQAEALSESSTAIGTLAKSYAQNGLAIGRSSNITNVNSTNSIAIGTDARVTGDTSTSSLAIGHGSNVSGKEAIAIGRSTAVSGSNSVALGSYITKLTTANSVVLGASSTEVVGTTGASHAVQAVNDATVRTIAGPNFTYSGFVGKPADAGHYVSIGQAGKERQIKNLAAGAVTPTSTDAINGSQLYALMDRVENKQEPVVYTNKAGDKLVKVGDKFYKTTDLNDKGQPNNVNQNVPNDDVIASMNNAGNNTTTPMALANIAGNLPGAKNGSTAPTTSGKLPEGADAPNTSNAATVGDVLNAGWNLTEKGDARDFVKPYDTVDFIDGNGTSVNVTTDGKVSHIKYDVKAADDSITVGKDGIKVNTGGFAEPVSPANDETSGQVAPKAGDNKKVASVGDVANAINNAFWKVTGAEDGGKFTDDNKTSIESVKAGNTVTFKAGQNIKLKQNGKNFTYSLNPELTDITSIGGNGTTMTFKPEGVSLGGSSITDLKPNLPKVNDEDRTVTMPDGTVVDAAPENVTKAPMTAEEAADMVKNAGNNAATVSDVLNAGWNLQNNGEAKDFVKPYDTVNFVDGKGTKAVVESDNETSNVTFNVDTVDMTSNPNGTVKNPMGDNAKQLLDDLAAAKKAVADNPDDEAAKAKLKDAEDAVNKAGGNKIATAQNVANMINNSGFTLKADKVEGGENTTDGNNANNEKLTEKGELIKPGSTVTMKAGKNMTVKHEANGNITYATKDDVEFNTVKVGKKEGGKSPVEFKTEAAKPATNNVDGKQPTTALNITSADGKPTQITGVASSLNTKPVETAPNVNLVDLNSPNVNSNAAATVGDLQNMGWVVSTKDGNGYVADVKNANHVDFKAGPGISVTGKTTGDGIREITIGVKDGEVVKPNQFTAKVNGVDTPVTKVGDEYYNTADIDPKTGKAKDGVNPVTPDAGTTPTNAGDGYVTGNKVATAIQKSGFVVGKQKETLSAADFKDEDEKVNPDDELRFADGNNTKVKLATKESIDKDGNKVTTTTVKVDVTGLPVQYTDKNGTPVTKVGDKYFTVDDKGNPTTTEVAPADLTTNMVNPAAAPNEIGAPTTLGNVKSNLPSVNDADKNAKDVDGNPIAGKDNKSAPIDAAKAADIAKNAGNNAATVSDVLNAGWNLQNNGEAKDFVKPYDTVNFVDGKGTKAVVESDNETSNVTFNVDTVDMTSNPNGTVKNPMGDNAKQLLDDLAAAKKAVADNPDDEAAKAKLKDAEDAVNKAGGNKIATAQNVANMINNSGFTLKADETDGKNETTDATLKKDGELIKPGSTVTMKAGKNMTVKHEKDGNITYATKDDVEFNTVKVGDNKDGKSPVEFKTEAAKPATNNVAGKQPTTALNVTSADGNPTQITGVASSLNKAPVTTAPNVNLVDLNSPNVNSNAAATVGDLQNMGWVVSTKDGNGYIADVKNANHVDFKAGPGISVTGKTTGDGIREITIGVKDGEVVKPNQFTAKVNGVDTPVTKVGDEYYNTADIDPKTGKAKDGVNPVTPDAGTTPTNAGDGYVTGNKVATAIQKSGFVVGKQKETLSAADFKDEDEKVNPDDELRFADGNNTKVKLATKESIDKDGNKVTTTTVKVDVTGLPVQYTDKNGTPVTKVGDKYFTVDDKGNPTTTEVAPADLTTNMVNPAAAPNEIGAPTTLGNVKSNLPETKNGNNSTLNQAAPTAEDADKVKNNAATVSDVLNAGWNLQNNGEAKDFVKPYDTVNFVDGKGTKAVVETTPNGTTSNVKFDIDTGKITNNDDGSVQGPVVTPEMTKALEDATNALNSLPTNAPASVRKAAEQAVADAANNIANVANKVATAQDVANAINKSGFTLTTSANGGEKISGTPEMINPGKKVEMVAGKNMTVKQDSNGKVTYATASNVTFDSVQFGDNGPKITNNGGNINVGTATGAPTKITGVAPGEISATSKDAVNGSQLYAMGNKLQGQINKLGNRMNAGMATSAAMANLLQPHKPGQSVATAGVGQHKNQSAVAVGYSRISDNGKYGIRFSMGANTQGEVTSGAAVGYFW